jgi:pimeloyl-ACP methyl ester carboxylesterase
MLRHKIAQVLLRLPASEFEKYVEIDDRKSPVTVFAFAGAAGLFGMTPVFEFRRLLWKRGNNYNLVFFRDLQASCYHLTPQGEPTGLDFYAGEIRDIIKRLGSTHNVAVGNSAGAGAALYFGARCELDQVIAFGPHLPEKGTLKAWWRALTDFRLLLQSPIGYTLGIGGLNVHRKLCRAVGEKGVWSLLDPWRGPGRHPKAVIYYGEYCLPDRRMALRFAETGNVECVALPTKSHGAARFLKAQGKLGDVIIDRIEAGLAENVRRRS